MKGLLFTYAMAYGGSAAALFVPFYGMLIYCSLAILCPPDLWFWSVPEEGRYSLVVGLAMLVGWSLRGLGNWNFGRAAPIVWSLVAWWIWGTLSGLLSNHAELANQWTIAQLKILLPFLVGITLIDSVAKLKLLAWTLVLSQGIVAYELNAAYYGGFNRVVEIGFAGMDNNCNAIAMVTGAGLAFFLGLSQRAWWRKLVCFALAALMAHVPMFGMSRGGMLALVVTGMASFLLLPKKPKHLLAFALACAVGLRLAGPAVVERFLSSFTDPALRDASAQSRLDMWADCCHVMLRFPVFGTGPNQWATIAPEYGWPQGKQAHSLWLQAGAELGFPGLALLLAFYGSTAWRLWRLSRQPELPDAWLRDAARMVIAALVGFAVAACFVTLPRLEIPYYVVLLGAGALRLASTTPEPTHVAQVAQNTAAAAHFA